jgi:hypothetical protein
MFTARYELNFYVKFRFILVFKELIKRVLTQRLLHSLDSVK